ncbi:MAG: shikimate kinase [Crocinitomicaceae bacterium]|nr:shikimate kinase [Crocinitomicaceae bacterium]
MRRVILIGFMGSGKTTLGKELATRMNIPFFDSDEEIERAHLKTVGEIFGTYGESRFREMETGFIDAMHEEDEFILSTGGGMPCFDKNMEDLNKLGTTFYLERSPKELAHRLRHAKTQRPLISGLSDEDLVTFIEDKLSEREEYYKRANFVLTREEQKVTEIERLINLLENPDQKS